MKLVEILARELADWPELATAARQYGRTVRFYDDGCGMGCANFSEVATDRRTAIVTRAMWEAERAKMEGKTEWDGEGLPPVGVVCEHQGDDEDCNSWFPVLTLAHAKIDDRYVAVFQRADDDRKISFSNAVFFRPIRTQEQIAAQEREDAVDEMVSVWRIALGRHSSECYEMAAALHDAGYRRQ